MRFENLTNSWRRRLSAAAWRPDVFTLRVDNMHCARMHLELASGRCLVDASASTFANHTAWLNRAKGAARERRSRGRDLLLALRTPKGRQAQRVLLTVGTR
jgi:hypothetical protein